MPWFAIRAVYRHDTDPVGVSIFEERVLMFRADDAEHALSLAEAESKRYLELNPTFGRIGEWGVFVIPGEELNGAEVWSVLSRSDLSPDEFFRRRYTGFEMQADHE